MDALISVLQVLLYVVAIVLLVVLTILGVKSIKLMDKADKIIDDVDSKVQSLNGLFNAIDKVGFGIDHFTDSVVNKVGNVLSKIFKSKKKSEEREDDNYE